jgi:transposase InsO family protein
VPWKESCPVSERMRFVVRLERGERMVDLCREFGISRKTGYKLLKRFQAFGATGLFDEPRRPERIPHRTVPELEALIVEARQDHPTWGPKKLRAWLGNENPSLKLPVPSTIGDLLKRRGLVEPRRRRRTAPLHEGPLQQGLQPNDVWCADFKGQFRLRSGPYCYPLTITDQCSRFLLACEALEGTTCEPARAVFTLAFREHGLPLVIRTDNGTPFASTGLAGLSRLSVWWMRLGIRPERIEPGHPEQNGRHERMHLTLKKEATRPAAASQLQQQERFDRFVHQFNYVRPHEALDQRSPATVYVPSVRTLPTRVPEPEYPLHDDVRKVGPGGHIRIRGRGTQFFISSALAGELVGIREVENGRWLVSFMTTDLGVIDLRARAFVPGFETSTPAGPLSPDESTTYQSPPGPPSSLPTLPG